MVKELSLERVKAACASWTQLRIYQRRFPLSLTALPLIESDNSESGNAVSFRQFNSSGRPQLVTARDPTEFYGNIVLEYSKEHPQVSPYLNAYTIMGEIKMHIESIMYSFQGFNSPMLPKEGLSRIIFPKNGKESITAETSNGPVIIKLEDLLVHGPPIVRSAPTINEALEKFRESSPVAYSMPKEVNSFLDMGRIKGEGYNKYVIFGNFSKFS
jgi:hypothetical protein